MLELDPVSIIVTALTILAPGGYAFRSIKDELQEIAAELKDMNGRQRRNTGRLTRVEQRLDSSDIP